MARRRRSLHFVPGGNDRMLAKALTLPADGLILDLEDAVAPDRKAATRGIVREWLTRDFGGRGRWVRMNPIATGLGEADLEETMASRPDGYVVPKPGSAADIRQIVRILDRLEQRHGIPNGATRLVLIATETAEASPMRRLWRPKYASTGNVIVASDGPPWVSSQTFSKPLVVQIVESSTTTRTTWRMLGIVM